MDDFLVDFENITTEEKACNEVALKLISDIA